MRNRSFSPSFAVALNFKISVDLLERGGSATKQKSPPDFEIFRFQVRFQDFKWDFKRFQDQDLKIS